MSDAPFTLGIWTVKPGHEEEFVAAWSELARWTRAEVDGSSWVRLLRDRAHPARFISFGPWRSLADVERWRSLPGMVERVGKASQFAERFEPLTMDAVVEIE